MPVAQPVIEFQRGSISRILSRPEPVGIIHLRRRLPAASSDYPRFSAGYAPSLRLAPGGVCRATTSPPSRMPDGTVSPTPATRVAGRFLSVTLSLDHSRPQLAATLPYGVRTFLPPHSEASDPLTLSGNRTVAGRFSNSNFRIHDPKPTPLRQRGSAGALRRCSGQASPPWATVGASPRGRSGTSLARPARSSAREARTGSSHRTCTSQNGTTGSVSQHRRLGCAAENPT